MNRALARYGWPAILLLVNLLIVGKLFAVEYTTYLGSIEGTFIAIARQIAAHAGDFRWWPLWDGGFPFQFTYLPLLQFTTAGWMRIAGESAALAFHQVTAAFFAITPVAVYFMLRGITKRPDPSFLASLFFSLFSPAAWFFPVIGRDLGNPFNLRRLQILVFWGEAPHIAMLAFLPLAILFLYRSIGGDCRRDRVLAGFFAGLTVLSNAFGAAILALAVVSLLTAIATRQLARNALRLGVIGICAYAWISPLVPPSVLAAIRADAPTSGGDYRFTGRSLEGVIALAAGFAVLSFATRKMEGPLRFFTHLTFLLAGIVGLGTVANIYVVPQAHRYQIAMDMGFAMVAVFGGASLLKRIAPSAVVMRAAFAVVLALCLIEVVHDVRYARGLIRATDIAHAGVYRVSRWFDVNMPGERVMVSGSYSLFFNDFSDNPQMLGAHDQMAPNYVMRIANYVLYAGTDPVVRDAQISIDWLRALGANAVSVPGPHSDEYYKPYMHPNKFEGVLPVLWRGNDDTIYGLPARSRSLAHVLPEGALVAHEPVNGLDVEEMERYIKAMDDPAMPAAPLTWTSRHSARIDATVIPGQPVSVQISYDRGWSATANGRPIPIARDGLGWMVLHPDCVGPCSVDLSFGYSSEVIACLVASLAVTAGCVLRVLFFAHRS